MMLHGICFRSSRWPGDFASSAHALFLSLSSVRARSPRGKREAQDLTETSEVGLLIIRLCQDFSCPLCYRLKRKGMAKAGGGGGI